MIRKLKKITVSVVILATVFQATPTFATPSDTPVSQGQIEATQEQINDFETKIQQLDNQIIESMEKSKKINEQIDIYKGKIKETETEIEKAKEDLTAHQNILSERMKTIQTDRNQSVVAYAEFLLSSNDISDFFSRFTALSQLIKSDTDLINGLNEKQQVLEDAEAKLHKEYEQLKKSEEDLESAQKRIEEDKKKIEKALAEEKIKLQNQQEEFARQEAERQARLAQEEAERQAQAEEAAAQQSQSLQETGEQPDESPQEVGAQEAPQQTVQQSSQKSPAKQPSKTTTEKNVTNSTNSVGADKIIAKAKQYLGVPYVWGGTSPRGFDCSGFTQYVFGSAGISLPRVSRDQQNVGTRISPSQVQPGDLVFNGSPAYHVGIYIGGGQYIHAPQTGDVVKIASYNPSKFTSAARVLH